MRRLLPFLMVGSMIGFAPSCDSDGDADEMCAGEPEIHEFELSSAMVAPGDTIEATFEVHNFELSGEGDHDHGDHDHGDHDHAQGGDAVEFRAACLRGHVHVYLNDLETNPVAMQTTATGDIVIPADAPAGQHTLIARLHNADHTIIEPQVMVEATITVQ